MAWLAAALVLLAFPASASAELVLRPVQHAGQVKGTQVFVGIVHKPGNRYRAYVSDATPKRATLSAWFRGQVAGDGSLSGTDHGVTLAARIADDQARGTVTLPDGRVLAFAMRERRGALIERNFIHEGVRYRSGWVVLEDRRTRGRTMVTGEALDGTGSTGLGVRPNPSCEQLREDYEVLRVQRGKLLHQAGVWELRLNQNRGSGAAYARLYGAITSLDIAIDEMDRRGVRYATCDPPSAGAAVRTEPRPRRPPGA